jgi:hypothetical protein
MALIVVYRVLASHLSCDPRYSHRPNIVIQIFSSLKSCHPERSKGPMHFLNTRRCYVSSSCRHVSTFAIESRSSNNSKPATESLKRRAPLVGVRLSSFRHRGGSLSPAFVGNHRPTTDVPEDRRLTTDDKPSVCLRRVRLDHRRHRRVHHGRCADAHRGRLDHLRGLRDLHLGRREERLFRGVVRRG